MFLNYKSLEYEEYYDKGTPQTLPFIIFYLWCPKLCNDFKLTLRDDLTDSESFLTQTIIITFLLKYYNNSQVMADFDLVLKDFYKNGHNFSPIFKLCEKYGRNISLKYAITAYNICLTFPRQSNYYNNKNFFINFSKNIKIDENFINYATSDIIDVSFNEFTRKYNVELSKYDNIFDNINKMLRNSLINVQHFDIISSYKSRVGQPIVPYNNSLNVMNFAKNIFNKKFGLQTLYCVISIGNVLNYHYYDYIDKIDDSTAQNLIELRSERFISKIENIFKMLYAKNGDFTMVNNYLKFVQDHVRYALRDLNKFEYGEHSNNERLDFSKPYYSDKSSGQFQIDGTATITKIHKICQLLDYDIISELVKMPVNMWETILDSKRDKFDKIMDEFNLAIINCGNLAFSTIIGDQSWKDFDISFNSNITPVNVKIIKDEFYAYQDPTDIFYTIPLFVNFYDYFNVVDDKESKTMAKNRLKLTEQVEKCLENMKKLANIKQVKENIKVTIEDC